MWRTARSLLIAAAGFGHFTFAGPVLAQQPASSPTKSVFGALPATAPQLDNVAAWMFAPKPITASLASQTAPPTAAFTPQDAPPVQALTAEQIALLDYAKRRSQSFIPASAFVATAETATAPTPRRPAADLMLAQANSASPSAGGVDTPSFQTHVNLLVNKSKNLRIAVPFTDATVGEPDIADVVPISDHQVNILGKKIGSTNVMLYDQKKHLIGVVDVSVQLDTGGMATELRRGAGGRGIRVSEVNGNIVLSGDAGDALSADRAMRVAAGMVPEGRNVVNNMSVASPQQVMLQVRFVEADRQAVRNVGVRWNAFWNNYKSGGVVGQVQPSANFATSTPYSPTGVAATPAFDAVSGAATGIATASSPFATILANLVNSKAGSLDVVLSALEEQQVVRRLAEPNLVALSGESADFLAGGEFPVPVSSTTGVGGAPTVTIQYKEFGVKLKFTPTVLANNVISLKLESEVSDLDPTIVVQTGGVAVPGITKRRANSTVELRSGQAFGLAGMLSSKSQRQLDAFPWLGTIPYLGALFSSKQFQHNETELVMLISPHLVKPMPPDRMLKTPLDTSMAANDIDFFLRQKTEIPKSPPTYVNAAGNAQTLDAGMAPGAPGIQEDPNRWHWPWEAK
jgi:pilus assembly protein CpaC